MAKIYTPAELAPLFRTDAKTLRIFLRADAKDRGLQAPGKGSRWAIPAADRSSMAARFRRWETARAEAKAASEAKAQEATEATETEAAEEATEES